MKSCRLEGFTREARKAPRQHVSHRVADGEGPIAVSLGSVGGKCSDILLVRRDWTSGREKLHSLFAVLFRTSGVPVLFPLLLRSFVRGLSLSQSAVLGVGGGEMRGTRRGAAQFLAKGQKEMSSQTPAHAPPRPASLSLLRPRSFSLSFVRSSAFSLTKILRQKELDEKEERNGGKGVETEHHYSRSSFGVKTVAKLTCKFSVLGHVCYFSVD